MGVVEYVLSGHRLRVHIPKVGREGGGAGWRGKQGWGAGGGGMAQGQLVGRVCSGGLGLRPVSWGAQWTAPDLDRDADAPNEPPTPILASIPAPNFPGPAPACLPAVDHRRRV